MRWLISKKVSPLHSIKQNLTHVIYTTTNNKLLFTIEIGTPKGFQNKWLRKQIKV